MSNAEIRAFEDAGRMSAVWSPEGYDGKTHYADVLKALLPATVLLAIATALLLTLLSI